MLLRVLTFSRGAGTRGGGDTVRAAVHLCGPVICVLKLHLVGLSPDRVSVAEGITNASCVGTWLSDPGEVFGDLVFSMHIMVEMVTPRLHDVNNYFRAYFRAYRWFAPMPELCFGVTGRIEGLLIQCGVAVRLRSGPLV